MPDYTRKKIVVVGLGETGFSCVDYFLKRGVIPCVIDQRVQVKNSEKLDPRIFCHFGSFNQQWLLDADLIVISPGVPRQTPELQRALENGIEIIGDIELFCREINALPNKRLVAITGSNGKTTVTTLIGEIAKHAQIHVGIGGNISPPALTLLDHNYDLFVLELSSFQLESTFSLHASIATILNISEDHMDRYPNGIDEYRAVKQKIYAQAECCLVNHDDPLTFVSQETNAKKITFGIETGDYHLNADYSALIYHEQHLMDCRDMQMLGLHNKLNALAAFAIADYLAIPRESTLAVLREFKGLDHRFQLVYRHNGVDWINDSKATNVGSTVAALKSVTCNDTLHLLLGGDGKGADFSELIPFLQNDICIYCFGQDRLQLAALNPEKTVVVDTLENAIKKVVLTLKPHDIVLLSPACASLDQFANYIQRGNEFTRLAKEFG